MPNGVLVHNGLDNYIDPKAKLTPCDSTNTHCAQMDRVNEIAAWYSDGTRKRGVKLFEVFIHDDQLPVPSWPLRFGQEMEKPGTTEAVLVSATEHHHVIRLENDTRNWYVLTHK